MRLEFLFVRCQIRTLTTVPPLLIARGTLSAATWNAWMEKEQLNSDEDPLVMDHNIIEAAVADQLQLLDGHRITLIDLRAALQEENRMNSASFQETVFEKLRLIQSTLDVAIQQRNNNAEVIDQPQIARQEALVEGEGAPREAQEREGILENVEFMEEGQELEAEREQDSEAEQEQLRNPPEAVNQEQEDAQPRDQPDAEDPPLPTGQREIEQELHRLRQAEMNFRRNIQLEAEREQDPEAEQEQLRNPPEADNQEDAQPRDQPDDEDPPLPVGQREIEQELHRLRQAELNFRRVIQVLMETPTCPPRRFEQGQIRLSGERFMRCVFCEAMGEHYSDSCHIVSRVEQRRQLVGERRLCILCLEYCTGGQFCKKRFTKCYHCRRTGHHSALCELPETTPRVIEQLTQARVGFGRCELRIRDLEERLHRLHN
ncbi:unnamed protein product [Haemonchus placei]|uniref:CCHC-type domain-containing protein n=1 Tax=Haemonchus placei TaxID=6290 RepID=A0A0N4W706_HAEPC|nr:unnamed protein product [Haemonchus placei]